jgi:hypothetical protein
MLTQGILWVKYLNFGILSATAATASAATAACAA